MAGQQGEWIQVRRKGNRLRNVPSGHIKDFPTDHLKPNPNPELSVDELHRYHQELCKQQRLCSFWEGELLPALKLASGGPNFPVIEKAVCLGPGPFEPQDGNLGIKRAAHIQMAVFGWIVEHLKSLSGQDIKCFVQEPQFTERDKELCARLGFEAVDSPRAFHLVDNNTLLFAIHMEFPIYSQALVNGPAICVGTDLTLWLESPDFSNDHRWLQPLATMQATYDSRPLPDYGTIFHRTIMYWRKEIP